MDQNDIAKNTINNLKINTIYVVHTELKKYIFFNCLIPPFSLILLEFLECKSLVFMDL